MTTVETMNEGKWAFLFIDPGGTTGVAAAHVELLGTLKKTLNEGVTMKKTVEVKGDPLEQARQLHEIIGKFLFVAQVENSIPWKNISIGFENYTRRPTARDNHLEPVQVMYATMGRLATVYPDLVCVLQEPSQAKGFATNERLKLWGMYEQGSEHRRDAMRHLCLRVNAVLP